MSLEKDLEDCEETLEMCYKAANRTVGQTRCVSVDMIIKLQLIYRDLTENMFGERRYYNPQNTLIISKDTHGMLYRGY